MENKAATEAQPLYLSKLLVEGRVDEVEALSRVVLEGYEDIESFSGYITVNEKYDSNLFFWFFLSAKTPPDEAPVLIYLNGGPGDSSMIGVFKEVGPLREGDDHVVRRAEHSWTERFNMIFIDNPVGIGFSFTGEGGISRSNDDVGDNLLTFLIQFLQLYPKYQKNHLYIGGQSYAGKYVPMFAYKVHEAILSGSTSVPINLKGIYIGCGFCEPWKMLPLQSGFLSSLGLATERQTEKSRERILCLMHKLEKDKKEETVKELAEAVFIDQKRMVGYGELDSALTTKDLDWNFDSYLNLPKVQMALHVKPMKYEMLEVEAIGQVAEDFLSGVSEQMAALLESDIKVLFFNGHMDMIVNIQMSEAFLAQLTWKLRDEYLNKTKTQWKKNGELAGYVTQVGPLTRVVLRLAGHWACMDQPSWCLEMMSKFVTDEKFES